MGFSFLSVLLFRQDWIPKQCWKHHLQDEYYRCGSEAFPLDMLSNGFSKDYNFGRCLSNLFFVIIGTVFHLRVTSDSLGIYVHPLKWWGRL